MLSPAIANYLFKTQYALYAYLALRKFVFRGSDLGIEIFGS
jgi:hypothetical protein